MKNIDSTFSLLSRHWNPQSPPQPGEAGARFLRPAEGRGNGLPKEGFKDLSEVPLRPVPALGAGSGSVSFRA